MLLFFGPFGVKLTDTAGDHASRCAVRGIGHRDPFRRRLRRQHRRVNPINHFNTQLFHGHHSRGFLVS